MIEKLRELKASVFLYDPLFTKEEIEKYAKYKENLENIDCIVIMTENKKFKDLNWEKCDNIVVIDTRRILDPKNIKLYYGIGYPAE